MIQIKRGLSLPIYGMPEQKIYPASAVSTVALVGPDYIGMKPTMQVNEGDQVKKGQVVFSCKKQTGVKYTAPAGGRVVAIHRGERRTFELLAIEVDPPDQEQAIHFDTLSEFGEKQREQVVQTLVESGMWTCLRARPYDKCPLPHSTPGHIFVQAMDTNPLAANPEVVISEQRDAFYHGLKALTTLTAHKVYVCMRAGSTMELNELQNIPQTELVRFGGPHPAGNPGTHIHFLGPANEHQSHWYLDAQDVIAIGKLFLHGELYVERVISLAGTQVQNPRLLQTRIGADLNQLTRDQLLPGESRIISGSIWHGSMHTERFHYLTRFARQITVLEEGRQREFLGWQSPGCNKFSVKPIYLSTLDKNKKFRFTTTTHGSRRAMVPIGMYEKVMPLDILPTQLLRALCSRDTENARKLGALELGEEDLALCTFVDPGKVDYGPLLREILENIEREG